MHCQDIRMHLEITFKFYHFNLWVRGHAATDTEKKVFGYFRPVFPQQSGHHAAITSPSVPAAILLLDDGLQVVIGFRSQLHGFGESGGPHWNQEKLLATAGSGPQGQR